MSQVDVRRLCSAAAGGLPAAAAAAACSARKRPCITEKMVVHTIETTETYGIRKWGGMKWKPIHEQGSQMDQFALRLGHNSVESFCRMWATPVSMPAEVRIYYMGGNGISWT